MDRNVKITAEQEVAIEYSREFFDKHWVMSILDTKELKFASDELSSLNGLSSTDYSLAFNGHYEVVSESNKNLVSKLKTFLKR